MAGEQSQRRPSWSLVRNPEQAEIYEVPIMPIAVCSISVCRQNKNNLKKLSIKFPRLT